MIRFFCKCGHGFSLDDAEAGGTTQCPDCGLLVDIPLHQDLASISEDGTYKLDQAPVLNNPEVAADLIYVYTKGAADIDGYEKDMRLTDQELDLAGTHEEIPLDPEIVPREKAPKYDPETGELIIPIDVKEHHPSIPSGAPPLGHAGPPTLHYATAQTSTPPSFFSGLVRLFAPGNMVVMFAIFCMHVLLWPLLFVMHEGFYFIFLAVPVMIALIVSHYGNVLEDVGPHDKDDLPRPLRDMDWYDDLWLSFCNVFGSLVICYWPLMPITTAMGIERGNPMLLLALLVVFAAMGTFCFPAVLLTLCASGTIYNLRPDRVLRLIAISGPVYFFLMLLWMLTLATYGWGYAATNMALGRLMSGGSGPNLLFGWPVATSALVVGIFLMHYLCYALGLLYRIHHQDFPWILQRHERTTPMLPQTPPPRRPKRATRDAQGLR